MAKARTIDEAITIRKASDAIREAIEPMRAAVQAQFQDWMNQAADTYDQELAAARAELEAAVRSTPDAGGDEYRAWNVPKCFEGGGLPNYQRSAERAIQELSKHLDAWRLAKRTHREGSRSFYYRREWLQEAAGYAKDRTKIPAKAAEAAESRVRATIAKLAGKVANVGDLEASSIQGRTPDYFRLELKFRNGIAVVLHTKMILNRREDRPYNQWPTRIYVLESPSAPGGWRIASEAELKGLAAARLAAKMGA